MAQDCANPSIILTADRLLMADYPTLLDGMTAAGQTTSTPEWLMRRIVAPALAGQGLRVKKAPLGLRLLESALLEGGFASDEVGIVAPENIERAVGARTRMVIVSSGDPLGLGMNNSTMSAIVGGRPYTPVWFERLLTRLSQLKALHPQFKVVCGGPGAWQLEQNAERRQQLGIDVLVCGYAEALIAQLAHQISAGATLEPVQKVSPERCELIPALRGPTSMGVVEISRGCGLGCSFCTIRRQPMQHLPLEKIVNDVRTNIAGGETSVSLISEDFLRYGAEGSQLAPGRLLELARAVRGVPSLRLIQVDHTNVSSAARYSQSELRAVHDALVEGVRHEYLWVNLGVETASGSLLSGDCRGKLYPFQPEDWTRVCKEAIEKLLSAGFSPMISLVFGLPGEQPEHLARTLELVESFRHDRLTVFPLFYASIDPQIKSFEAPDMTALHWKLFRLCYSISFRHLAGMFWDNQRGAGVPLTKRLLIQAGGRVRVLDWRRRMWLKSLGARA